MAEGQPLDGYIDAYRASVDEAVLEAFDEYTDAFRLADQILGTRKHLGLTQVQLASRSEIAQTEISRIERGEGNPTIETLSRVGRPLRSEPAVRAHFRHTEGNLRMASSCQRGLRGHLFVDRQ